MMLQKHKVGQKCKCLNSGAYRGEEPFLIVGVDYRFKTPEGKVRAVYLVEYADGKLDQIPIEKDGGYEIVCGVRTKKFASLTKTGE